MLNNSSSYPIRPYGYKKITINLENPRVDELAILWRLLRNNENYLSSDETYMLLCNSWEIKVKFSKGQSIIRKSAENGQLYYEVSLPGKTPGAFLADTDPEKYEVVFKGDEVRISLNKHQDVFNQSGKSRAKCAVFELILSDDAHEQEVILKTYLREHSLAYNPSHINLENPNIFNLPLLAQDKLKITHERGQRVLTRSSKYSDRPERNDIYNFFPKAGQRSYEGGQGRCFISKNNYYTDDTQLHYKKLSKNRKRFIKYTPNKANTMEYELANRIPDEYSMHPKRSVIKEDGIYMVIRKFSGKDLYSVLLEDKGDCTISIERRLQIAVNLIEAVQISLKANVVHRDIKPHNIILMPDDQIRLCDFGLAGKKEALDERNVGTVTYKAPELLLNKTFCSATTDLYSLGRVLFLWFRGEYNSYIVTRRMNIKDKIKTVNAIDYETLFADISTLSDKNKKVIRHMIQTLLSKKPHQRPSLSRCLKQLKKILNEHRKSAIKPFIFVRINKNTYFQHAKPRKIYLGIHRNKKI